MARTIEMKNILIIYPHWHPVNLAGVHRPRLIGNFLTDFDWHPVILTVKEEFFEEKPDYDFEKTFRDHYEVHRVNAFRIGKIRLFGDIGIRAFYQLYIKAIKIINSKKIDFIWIPVPSYYPALLGRLLYKKFRIPYGIDYIDPWVRDMSNYPNYGIRQRLSLTIAKFLEPIAVKNVALISGVAKSYYQSVLDRNNGNNTMLDCAMPYGFDPMDNNIELPVETPWADINIRPFIYAGAFMPNASSFFYKLFGQIKELQNANLWDNNIRLYFIGTGMYPGKTIKEIALECNIGDTVVENRERYPFLHILHFLNKAEGVMAIGSPSAHYTASKIFQSVLSRKPVFAYFHSDSTVVQILKEAKADAFLMMYSANESELDSKVRLNQILQSYFALNKLWSPDFQALNKYSARTSAAVLVSAINKCIER